jgi:hypothetical protein
MESIRSPQGRSLNLECGAWLSAIGVPRVCVANLSLRAAPRNKGKALFNE